MNAINYISFVNAFRNFEMTHAVGGKIESFGRTSESFIDNIHKGIPEAKIFEIDNDIKNLLALTKTPNKNDEIKSPFPYVFLDVGFTKEELANLGVKIKASEMRGILFTEGNLVYDKELQSAKEAQRIKQIVDKVEASGEAAVIFPGDFPTILDVQEGETEEDSFIRMKAGRALRITMLSLQDNGEYWFDTFNKNYVVSEPFKGLSLGVKENPTTDKRMREFVHKFVINFLNFLHTPEVDYVEHVRSQKNIERRMKSGKVPIPSTNKIKVTGVIKKYIDGLSSRNLHGYNYRFWVRGHYRQYTDDRYKKMKGKVQWIPPFIKGQGVMIDKMYTVGGGEV